MKLKSKHYYIRKSHRYLGLILGVQFLFWTVGGLYFSWNDIDEVHGDHLRKEKRHFPASLNLVSPHVVLESIKDTKQVDSVLAVQLIDINGMPAYQVRYFSGEMDHSAHNEDGHMPAQSSNVKVQLANAETGQLVSALTEKEAVNVARAQMADPIKVEKVEYLTEVGSHHEYRGKPLPAWAVTFSQPDNCTAYVSAELGTFQSIRHNQWRVFDFFWMLHTMDYQGRDNFGNILLRAFSIFGLFTVLSGFVLYFVSSPSVRKVKKRTLKAN
ncbi:putative iron-regulated membrane protein [Pontibacter aydingkolensis]|uniref:PepSY domain-containing protein n=1 Tax=Pontibacter aydingkolensis TaxID=1911536 RepID=A0ABS7CY36_9BACT|nr:PepSY domain-containing protein [Pontibacter aydingkolensis]MBW7468754.1 PepSY domain-containing protein [Pontibacter aydingkolensis]